MSKNDLYELHREIVIAGGSAAAFPKNVSSYHNTVKNRSYAAVAHRYQVNFVSWDTKLDGFEYDTLMVKDPGHNSPAVVVQARFCAVKTRTHPLLVVCTIDGFGVYEVDNKTPLTWQIVTSTENDIQRYTKGIGVNGHYICVGDHTGALHILSIGEHSVKVKPNLEEHKTAIVDIGDDLKDWMISAEQNGTLICWDSSMKAANKISTGLDICLVSSLRGCALACTVLGEIDVYSVHSGELLVQIAAHARIITGIHVSHESKLFLTCSEDSFVRVWKLSAKKSENEVVESAQVECVYNECIENAPLVGCCFNPNSKGHSFCVTAYDHSSVFFFKSKKDK